MQSSTGQLCEGAAKYARRRAARPPHGRPQQQADGVPRRERRRGSVEVLLKLGELVVVPLMEDAKSLASFLLTTADLSHSLSSAATLLDSFLSPALLGLPVAPSPDASPLPAAFRQAPVPDLGPVIVIEARVVDNRGTGEELPNAVAPRDDGPHSDRPGLLMSAEETAALCGANGWGHVFQSLSTPS